ncbi:hypothetical protein SAMN03080617_01728 [Algoriphagus alkaliphilus]|uniref:Uncharacterized protein n=1 Tax=Algoriphagus alkaliphilus TaxID=279824 RepID=A0A1G5XHK2_9BACT|nr:hypothetical protein SAMN03080617_01728 [Algoriphagus alkaliphilus]
MTLKNVGKITCYCSKSQDFEMKKYKFILNISFVLFIFYAQHF